MTQPEQNSQEPVTDVAGSEGEKDQVPEEAAAAGQQENAAEENPAEENAAEEIVETPEQSLQRQLDERIADLQRLQAEYVNYRRRVERDRAAARDEGKVDVLKSLLTVLDDLGRADQHGELTGGFKAVADQLWSVVGGHQLEQFGQAGDTYDAHLHDALFTAGSSPDVSEQTVAQIVKTGYRVGDKIIRHAEVGVIEPETDTEGDAQPGDESAEEPATGEQPGAEQPSAEQPGAE